MDKRRTKASETRAGRPAVRKESPPLSSRTRSKSPARVENSGRDSAPIVRRGRKPKTDTPSEESSSQSSTPKKEVKKNKKIPTVILDDSGDNDEVAEINTRSTRLSTLRKRLTPVNYKITPTPSQDEKRSVSRSVSSLTKEDSQDDESDEVEIAPAKSPDLGVFSKPIVVVSLLLSLLIVPILLQLSFKEPLSLSKLLEILKNPETYCNRQSGSFFIAFLSGTVLLAFVPIARVVKLPASEIEHKFNGFLSAFIIAGFLIGLELRGLDSLTAIYNNIDRFLFLSVISNLIIAGVLFIRAKRQPPATPNPYANSGRFIKDFAAGLEINPRVFNRLDVKAISYHRSIILILIINIALLFKNVSVPVVESSSGAPIGELIKESYNNLVFIVSHSEYNCASLIVSGLLVVYALDLLIFEHHLATSFQVNDEGCGAELLLRFATFPFLLSLLPRFLLVERIEVNCWVMTAIAVVFLIGLAVKRCSNCLKYEYRMNPADGKFKDLVTLPTLQNHRLIISRWWSKIRQPNLFGEILIHLSLLAPLAISFNWPAFLGIVFIIEYLIVRSIIINRRNASKYESSWQRYTTTVKYNLLPRVY